MCEAVFAFRKKIECDVELEKKVRRLGSDLVALVALAKEEGFEFTLQELIVFFNRANPRGDELSDEELKKVAGGTIALTADPCVIISLLPGC
jgi:predicted ribosomally synthesized peptide with nif11-like leader